jgi:hypothetical protein
MLTFDMAGHKGRLWSMCKPNFLSLRCRLVDDGCGADYCTAIFSAEEETSASRKIRLGDLRFAHS